MKSNLTWRRWVEVALLVSASAVYQIPGASCAQKLAHNVNPCGTILVCDPLEYEYAVGNLDPFNPNFEDCPISVIPSACTGGVFPPVGNNVVPEGTVTTNTGTNTNTNNQTGLLTGN